MYILQSVIISWAIIGCGNPQDEPNETEESEKPARTSTRKVVSNNKSNQVGIVETDSDENSEESAQHEGQTETSDNMYRNPDKVKRHTSQIQSTFKSKYRDKPKEVKRSPDIADHLVAGGFQLLNPLDWMFLF